MLYTKQVNWILVSALVTCGIIAAHMPLLGSAPMTVQALKPDDIIRAEESLVRPRIRDEGFAEVRVRSKSSLFREWMLNAPRPDGKCLEATAEVRDRILAEFRECLGPVLGRKEVVAFAEVYDHLLPEAERKNLEEHKIPVRKASGKVYFIPVQVGGYKVQILGELGDFVSVLVRLPEDRRASWRNVCRQFFPTIDLAALKRDDEQYTKGVVDDFLRGDSLQVRTGRRMSPQGPFYGLRVDVDVPKLKAAVKPKPNQRVPDGTPTKATDEHRPTSGT